MKMASNRGPIFGNSLKSTSKYNELYNPAPVGHTIRMNQAIAETVPVPKTNLGLYGLYN